MPSGIALVLLLVVAWLTAAGTAVRSVSRIWLRHWVERRLGDSPSAQLYLDRPQRLLMTAGAAIAAAVFLVGVTLGATADDRWSLVRQLLITSASLLLLGQLLPRAIARHWASALVPLLVPILRAATWALAPVFGFTSAIVRALFPRQSAEEMTDPKDALEDLLREGELEGVGEAAESAIISGVMEFGAKQVAAVMTARAEIVSVDRSLAPEVVAATVAQSKYSRLPVTDGDLDRIVGVVHSFDVIDRPTAPLRMPRAVAFARPDQPCQELMQQMLRARSHLAIVQDARGRTVGLVTLEDLVEELVGDIHDEHDEAPVGVPE